MDNDALKGSGPSFLGDLARMGGNVEGSMTPEQIKGSGPSFPGDLARMGRGGREYDIYVNPTTGNDANPGTIDQPKATIAAAIASYRRIGLVRNGVWREQINLTDHEHVHIGAYGLGDAPRLYGSVAQTSGWVNVSGDVWEKNIGFTAANAFVTSGSTVTKLILGTYGALTDGQFATSGNLLQVRIGAGVDPNTITIEVPQPGTIVTATGIYSRTDANVVRDVACWFWEWNGGEVASGTGFQGLFLDLSYNSNDGFGAHDAFGPARDVLIGESVIRRNGRQRGVAGEAGDGISYHDETTGIIRGCTITDNEKQAIGNAPSTDVVIEFNTMRNNRLEFIVVGSGTAAQGRQRLHYNVIVWPGTNTTTGGFGAVHISASTPRPQVEVYNNVIYAESTSSGLSGLRVAGGDVVARNNVIMGFNRGIDYRSTDTNASLSNNYNCMFGNTTNYFNNGTPGVVPGADDVLANPLFVNAGAGDFALQSGSPCRGAGVDVGLTTDKAGNPVTSPPDIGAYQYAP